MGKGYRKGFLMALLFGLGLTFTITASTIVIALARSYLGMTRATRGRLEAYFIQAGFNSPGKLGRWRWFLSFWIAFKPRSWRWHEGK